MPVRIKSKAVQEARTEFLKKFKSVVTWCELDGKPGVVDCHEFIGKYSKKLCDEVNILLLTHPANVLGISNGIHLYGDHGYKTCQAAIEKRSTWVWLKLGFSSWQQARIDFERKVREFYKSGRIRIPLDYVPKL